MIGNLLKAGLAGALALVAVVLAPLGAAAKDGDAARLVGAMLGETPIISDLRQLTDTIGGRVTGTPANAAAVEWGLAKFRAAGIAAEKEAFTMPGLWVGEGTSVRISGAASFAPRAVARAFSAATTGNGLAAPLVDGGFGTDADFARLGASAKGAWVLLETVALTDARGLGGLFESYMTDTAAERRAKAAGVAGIVFMSSRPQNLLYRYVSTFSYANTLPIIMIEREGAKRALRTLRAGNPLRLSARVNARRGPAYTAYNVIGEIRGAEKPDEIVLVGAHLDSWALGTGALDNGANISLVIDMARQIKGLGLRPRRTIRFALFNGEEQSIQGSWGYVIRHAAELDRHVLASAYDIGSGRINGYFTNGRPELGPIVDRLLKPVAGLGPFTQVDDVIIGTDNFDFMLNGVVNLVGNQESANYPSNYHSRADTFDKVDQRQLKLNSAIAAALTYGFADSDIRLPRQTPAEVRAYVDKPVPRGEMAAFGYLADWNSGKRGRH